MICGSWGQVPLPIFIMINERVPGWELSFFMHHEYLKTTSIKQVGRGTCPSCSHNFKATGYEDATVIVVPDWS